MKTITFKVAKQHQEKPVMAIGIMLRMAGDRQPPMNFDRCDKGAKTIRVTFGDGHERVVRAMVELYEAVYVEGQQ